MSYYLAPIANEQSVDANGSPVSGGRLYTYIAGTTTPATTYTDDSGATPQANPIILNSLGVPASPVWLQGGRTYKFVFQDANGVQTRPTIDDVTGINDVTGAVDQWVAYGNSPTYIGATSFSVEGDQTPTFQVGRRVRSTNTAGFVYSSISASSYDAGSGLTTVTVANDSGALDSGLSTISYGLLSVTNPSFPRATSAQAAAGTSNSTVITPAGLFAGLNASGTAPIYGARAWVNFNGTGIVAIRASGNVSSITDNGTGDYTINFATAMPDANYAWALSCDEGGASASTININQQNATAPTTTALRIIAVSFQNATRTAIDVARICAIIYR